MATQLSIGPSNGGVGTGQVDLTVTLTFNNSAEASSYQLKNTFSPLYTQLLHLAAGANVINVPQPPSTPGGLFILPQPEATYKAVLRGHASDLGLALNQNAPSFIAFGSPGTKLYSAQAVTLTNATEIVNLATHGLVANQRIIFGGTLPAELSQQTVYYVIPVAAGTFQVALSPGGSAVAFTTDGSGVTISTIDPPPTLNLHWSGKGYNKAAVTITNATDKVGKTAHGLVNGDRIQFFAASLPGGVAANTWYYVINRATDDFEISATPNGSKIDITSDGSDVVISTADLVRLIWV